MNCLAYQQALPAAAPGLHSANESVNNEKSPLSRIQSMSWAPLLSLKDVKLSDNGYGPDDMPFDGDLRTASGADEVQSGSQPTLVVEDSPDDMSLIPETQLLAVANDCGNIYLIEILSSYNYRSKSWSGNIVQDYSAFDVQSVSITKTDTYDGDDYMSSELLQTHNSGLPKNRRPSLFADAYQNKSQIDSVHWSPWRVIESNGKAESTVTTIRAGATSHTSLLLSSTHGDIEFQLAYYRRVGDALELSPSTAIWCRTVKSPFHLVNWPNICSPRTRNQFSHMLVEIDSALPSTTPTPHAICLLNVFPGIMHLASALGRMIVSPLRLQRSGIRSMVCSRSRS